MMIEIRSTADVDHHLDLLAASAARTRSWLLEHSGTPLDMMRALKFEPVGCHPVEDRPLNAIEQINQTWTYMVAMLATRQLLGLHPEAGGYRVAPGAHMSLPLDIMSITPGLVGAETFAATHPASNNKLNKDMLKLAGATESHRYVFMMCPGFSAGRHIKFEKAGIQVWAVEPDL
ncbi:hypothetical protein KB221_06285 [Aquidulcibacter paucihalophilus]|jgi:hypothetical protein|nr:hypothetical protein KB221_06285 [Aquidulcibacter paucihalophilus]